ncbi:MAG: leucyl aminopeptidase [Acidobacteria bacterium]|nr:MAG: leucyl aminopeptidase [Acidobacteriota bacterium]PYU59247.1 MAG: leucyl aminopeptidase [Acidobacteriota bacterium]PYU62101.1 MAG: leucyl aminopeptidase [Acidobacteriota bacterium]PYU72856.1 MAG: leucyl aminopeptidase [Acidobacteriota bacterium]
MQITLVTQPFAAIETDALVSYVFEETDLVQGRIAEIDQAAGGLLRKLAKSGELTGKMLEFTLVHAPAGLKAARLLLVGVGKREQYSIAALRKVAGAALRHLKARSVKNLAFLVREGHAAEESAQAIAEGVLAGNFETDKYKTEKKNDKNIETVLLAGSSDAERASAEKGLSKGRIIAEAQNFTRDLVNEPSNKLTPRILAEKAEAMAKGAGLSVEILDEKKIADLKMGALLSVAQGGPEPPRVIVVTYTPANLKPGAPVIGLVGKAITFDTGGISIKPADGMEKMKYDMAGGATMLGVMRALAALKPSVKVICVVPSSENMPGGKAQKPGDIQTAMSGKTIEVLNTDAEGRLVLADGVHYAKQLGATYLVDAATLTGAIVVALANVNVGVFGSDQPFTDRLLASSKAVGEKMWQMPIDDDYREFIKGTVADIQNIGSGKGGGAIAGAMFIKEFTGDTPWIHLDIAGTAWNDDAKPWLAKGPTGVALRTLVHLVLSY